MTTERATIRSVPRTACTSKRLPGLRLAVSERQVPWKTGLLVRGPLELPLDWDAGSES